MHWDIVICHLKNHVKIVAGILQRIMYIYLWYVMDMVEVAMFEVILVLKLQQMLLLKKFKLL